ncbi:MAG: mechanosensitive ion channel family protein [Nocardioidaceae bacterium]
MAEPVCSPGTSMCSVVYDLTHSEGLSHAADWLIAKPLAVVTLLVIAVLIRWLTHRVIDRVARRAIKGSVPGVIARAKVHQMYLEHTAAALERRQQRVATMATLLKSIATGVIFTIFAFMVIAQLGYNIAPLIASAGIIGVALGFGAQSLVKDFLSGIFLILEDQYGVGDVVNLGSATGTIESVGLRVTRLHDSTGVVWYVRNGEILAVGNSSQAKRPTADSDDGDAPGSPA